MWNRAKPKWKGSQKTKKTLLGALGEDRHHAFLGSC